MARLALLVSLVCLVEAAYGMGTYYAYYPDSGAAYQVQPYSPYMYSPYAPIVAPADCDKKEGGSSESSSSSSESKEEGKEEGGEGSSSSSSEEGGESKEEGEGSSSSSSSSEEGGSKEEGEKKEKKEEKPLFPPVSYYPPRPAQFIYSAPVSYPYSAPYRSYSVIQQPLSNGYPYYAYSAPTARVVSTGKVISPSAYSVPTVGKSIGYAPSAAYWAPSANMAYYKA